ncbi:MAG: murein L,D-transpeptidase family protein [Rudaea sp.]|uniref:L,D-transpeptidase family protein n=1 Tax=Rudaea sp. TaxID=2136325 RepID=UPI0039E44F82
MTAVPATAVDSAELIPDSARAREAEARVRPALERDLATVRLRYGAPVFVRIFKRESELELWLREGEGKFILFRKYPVCKFSGDLGPKQREGDNQAPEGFYSVAPKQLNPTSKYHLAFNLGYPNEYDRAHGRTGSALMVHGDCVSIGCYAMGDAGIEEIYTLAAAALRAGQGAFDVHVFPFRPTDAALAASAGSPWHAFWQELAPAYALFERDHVPPRISVENGRYRIASAATVR